MEVLVVIALLGITLDWLVAVVLGLAALQVPRIPALSHMAAGALVVAVVATLGWVVLDNARSPSSPPAESLQAIGAMLIVLLSLPAIVWLLRYLRGDFR